MSDTISLDFVLGIYGDGQLARLLSLTAKQWGISCAILTTNAEHSPCKHISDYLVEAKNWNDIEAFHNLVNVSSVIVLENEFVSADLLQSAGDKLRLLPNLKSYRQLSNKLQQIQYVESLGLRVPSYKVLETSDQVASLRSPCMLKHIRGGYDGYGNFSFLREDQKKDAADFVARGGTTLAQEFIDFDTEVAVVVAKSATESALFPVNETIQENNICHFVLTPPRLPASVTAEAERQAKLIVDSLPGEGLFAVEFFVKDKDIIFNEIAPRPHNSAHLTMEACNVSQYDALLRLALKLPLPKPVAMSPAAGMLNLLGKEAHQFQGAEEFFQEGSLHLYGKKISRRGRKMGHYTLLSDSSDEVLQKLRFLKERYQI